MAEPTQYAISHRELLELLIKHVGIHEGRWMLQATFGIAPGNYGPTHEQAVPGVAIGMNTIGIQRAPENIPEGMTMDAAVVNPPPKTRRTKA